MNFAQAVIGGMFNILLYGVIIAGVYKLFKMGEDLGEIKDLLRSIERERHFAPPPPAASAPYPESIDTRA